MSTLKTNNIEHLDATSPSILVNAAGGIQVGGALTATTGTFSGNVSVAGVLSYEDVTNIDSVGIVTARNGIRIPSGSLGIGTESPAGTFQLGDSNGSNVIIAENTGIDINDGAINLYQATSNVNATPLIISTDVGGIETEKLRFTAAGQLLIHHTQNVAPDGYASVLQLADDSYQGSSTVWKRAAGSSAGANPALILQKVRGTDIDGQGAVSDSDSIGQIRLYGADGTTAIECANIGALVDNTVSTNNVPGKLVFSTAKLLGGQGSAVMPTQAMTIKASHNIEIHDGNLIFETAGTGIDFSATSDGSGTMDSELLDDYEEGTFTPGVSFGGGGVGITYGEAVGTYTKVGRFVFCTIVMSLTNKGSSSGNVLLTGLPYATQNDGNARGGGGFTYMDAFTSINHIPATYAVSNSTVIYVYQLNSSAGAGTRTIDFTSTNFTNSSTFRAYFSYYTNT